MGVGMVGCGPTGQLATHASRAGQTAAAGYRACDAARSCEIHGFEEVYSEGARASPSSSPSPSRRGREARPFASLVSSSLLLFCSAPQSRSLLSGFLEVCFLNFVSRSLLLFCFAPQSRSLLSGCLAVRRLSELALPCVKDPRSKEILNRPVNWNQLVWCPRNPVHSPLPSPQLAVLSSQQLAVLLHTLGATFWVLRSSTTF